MARPSKFQKAVGRCPICGRYPGWFNDVPLTAFCWGPAGPRNHEKREARCVVPWPLQPYGRGPRKARWKIINVSVAHGKAINAK